MNSNLFLKLNLRILAHEIVFLQYRNIAIFWYIKINFGGLKTNSGRNDDFWCQLMNCGRINKFWWKMTYSDGYITNSGGSMTISSGTFTISGALQNRFPIYIIFLLYLKLKRKINIYSLQLHFWTMCKKLESKFHYENKCYNRINSSKCQLKWIIIINQIVHCDLHIKMLIKWRPWWWYVIQTIVIIIKQL